MYFPTRTFWERLDEDATESSTSLGSYANRKKCLKFLKVPAAHSFAEFPPTDSFKRNLNGHVPRKLFRSGTPKDNESGEFSRLEDKR